ncbi:MAG: type II toxin-antitoxin system RelE/ParE family toxin [Chloroflexi bacterium]|nr:type II toxin-antitoxin system RelE/ParE family toxin [Chloroflexota bacterium]
MATSTKIEWSKKAHKQLRKAPVKMQRTIINAVEDLPTTDGWRNVIALTNHQCKYRLRVGRYRVFFDLEQGEVRIYLIQEVKKRDERTY